MRVSQYTRVIELDDQESLVLNIPRRTADIVPTVHAMQLDDPEMMEPQWREYALRVGYLSDVTHDEEVEWFTQMVRDLRSAPQPVNVVAVTTNTCNFACSYCFQADSGMRRLEDKHLSADEADQIVAQMRTFATGPGVGQFELMGGEPLLPKLREVIERLVYAAEELHVPVRVTTNGYFLDQFADLLGETLINEIQVTLDGDEIHHNQRRIPRSGQPTFRRILDNIRLALDRGVQVQIRANVDRRNVESMPALISLLEDERILNHPLVLFHPVAVVPDPFSEDGADGDYYMDEVEMLREVPVPSVRSGADKGPVQDLTTGIHAIMANVFADACGAPSRNYYFAPGGEVFNCHELIGRPSLSVGTFRDGSFRELPIRALWRKRTVDQLENCRVCPLALAHGGGCGARLQHDQLGRFGVCGGFPSYFDHMVRALWRGEAVDLGLSCGTSCSV